MNTISADILAKECKRLKDDVFLREAIDRIRRRAMDALVSTDPADTNEIIAQQVRIRFCSEVFSELESMNNSGQAKKPKTVV